MLDDVDILHVERNHLVGCSYLVIIDYRFNRETNITVPPKHLLIFKYI
jgi:hypothetical protein